MPQTLLQIGQAVARRVKTPSPVPTAIIGSEGSETLYQAVLDAGDMLLKGYDWSILQEQGQIVTQSGKNDYALPADFDRFIPVTGWDATNQRQMRGSTTPQTWQWANNVTVTLSQFRRLFRLNATPGQGTEGTIRIFPTPTDDGSILVYEYISENWAQSSSMVPKPTMDLDTDTPRIADYLVSHGATWMLRSTEGLAYLDQRNDWERAVVQLAAQDAPPRTAFANRDPVWARGVWDSRAWWPCNLPDGGFGQ